MYYLISQQVCWITYGHRDHELNCSDMDDVNSTNINLHIDLKGEFFGLYGSIYC